MARRTGVIAISGGAVSLRASCSTSCNATAHTTDLIDIVDAVRLFLGDELIEMTAEGGGGERLVAVGTLFILGSWGFGARRIATGVVAGSGCIA